MALKLLDCTLRDGGYINDWNFGTISLKNITQKLIDSGIDSIEIGFLDERVEKNLDKSIMPDMYTLNEIFGDVDKKNTELVAMIDIGTFNIDKVLPKEKTCIDGIRVIFKKEKMAEAMSFCKQLNEKGYKVYANAVTITTYKKDEEVESLVKAANETKVDFLTLVDTSGVMYPEDIERYYTITENNLDPNIGIGFHSHNTIQLSFANCIQLMKIHNPNRVISIDGSLTGMGKGAGNASTELLANYMNKNYDRSFKMDEMIGIIENEMTELRKKYNWGYDLTRFVASIPDCYYKFVDYYRNIKKISLSEISFIIETISEEDKYEFNPQIADQYLELYYKKKQRYKYIIFDIDGTLLDTTEGIISAIDYTIKKCNLNELDYTDKLFFIGPPIQDSFKKAYNLSKEEADKVANVFRERYKTKELLKAKVYDGIMNLLMELKRNNMKIAIATYKREDYTIDILKHFGIDKYCDVIHGSDYEGKRTKNDIIKMCIKEMNVDNISEVVMIGDSNNDYVGAIKNGIAFIGVTYGFGFKENEPIESKKFKLVKSVSELKSDII